MDCSHSLFTASSWPSIVFCLREAANAAPIAAYIGKLLCLMFLFCFVFSTNDKTNINNSKRDEGGCKLQTDKHTYFRPATTQAKKRNTCLCVAYSCFCTWWTCSTYTPILFHSPPRAAPVNVEEKAEVRVDRWSESAIKISARKFDSCYCALPNHSGSNYGLCTSVSLCFFVFLCQNALTERDHTHTHSFTPSLTDVKGKEMLRTVSWWPV